MIEALGKKRVFLLVILLAINAFIGAVVFLYLLPEKQKTRQQLRAVSGQVSTVQNDLNNLRVDLEDLQKQQSTFETLSQRGFFDLQGRKQAVSVLEGLDEKSGVISSKVSISAGEVDRNPEAVKAGYVVLSSPVSITIEAVDDVDIFNYIHLINNVFPGHVSIDEFVIKRELDVSGTILRAIAAGERPKMVDGRVEMTWRTMIPQSAVRQTDEGGGI